MEAFRLAARLGATGLETDAWLTADGEAVLDHDGVVKVGRRKRPIAELARADLPEHIPSLGDLLDACRSEWPGMHVSIDLKGEGTGERIIAQLTSEFPELVPTTWLCHHSLRALLPLRQLADGVRLVNSTRLERLKEGPERRAATLAAKGIDGINLHHTDWSGGMVALFHRFERTAFAWDLQHDHLLRGLLRMGIDAVYSDWVDRMVDAYTAELGPPRR